MITSSTSSSKKGKMRDIDGSFVKNSPSKLSDHITGGIARRSVSHSFESPDSSVVNAHHSSHSRDFAHKSAELMGKKSEFADDTSLLSNCTKNPDSCSLCGMGLSLIKCMCCEDRAHVRCVRAFLKRPIGDAGDLDKWKCPRCVTLDSVIEKQELEQQQIMKANPVSMPVSDQKTEKQNAESKLSKDIKNQKNLRDKMKQEKSKCIFCQLYNPKNCWCKECVLIRDRLDPSCTCFQNFNSEPVLSTKSSSITIIAEEFNSKKLDSKPLTVITEESIDITEEPKKASEIKNRRHEKEKARSSKSVKSAKPHWIWSVMWVLLFCTLAFPIAVICAPFYIIFYTFEGCCQGCHPMSVTFLKGVRLPGTCVDNTCKRTPMC